MTAGLNNNKEIQVPRNKPTQEGKAPKLRQRQDSDESNQRQHKQMERYTMFLDWKNDYSENKYTTQSIL